MSNNEAPIEVIQAEVRAGGPPPDWERGDIARPGNDPDGGEGAIPDHSALTWCIGQAETIMRISAKDQTTRTDARRDLDMINSLASDICILIAAVLAMLAVNVIRGMRGEGWNW